MPTRRTTLKTIAAGTVVGSLSGCVQLATQRTVEYNGTPAIVQSETRGGLAGTASNDGYLATAVGVEARKTIERLGVTREIVAHSWGLLYSFVDVNNTGSSVQQVTMTFTTPSIEIAGRELNPIKDLTVGEIGGEFASINVENPYGQSDSLSSMTVDDATGKKVLRAFRDAVGSPGAEYEPPSLDTSTSGGTLSTVPDWDGEVHEVNISIPDEGAESISGALRFDKHDGDFVVLFRTAAESVNIELQGDYGDEDDHLSYVHPPDDEFNQEVLRRHLLETNLRGAQGLVEQGRKLIDEIQELLAKASNKTRNEENSTFQLIDGMQDTIGAIQDALQGVSGDTAETIRKHADEREIDTDAARQAIEDGEPEVARESLREVRAIVEEDIQLLENADGDWTPDVLELERKLLDQTDAALEASNKSWNEEDETFQVVSNTQEDLKQLDTIMGGLAEDLQTVTKKITSGGTLSDLQPFSTVKAREKSEKAAKIAARAHERVASNNDTRNEEDDRFVQIERNLDGLMRVSRTIQRTVANGRKTVKARDV